MAGSSAKGRRGRHRIHKVKQTKVEDVRSEINVTPLVDVCLVLLIIFMVVTPMLARGKEVPLPKTTHHMSEDDSKQPIVAIDGSGRYYFDKEQVADIEALKHHVQEAWRTMKNESAAGRVYVKADKDLPYGKVYPLILAMRDIQAASVDLGTNELREDSK